MDARVRSRDSDDVSGGRRECVCGRCGRTVTGEAKSADADEGRGEGAV